MFELNLGITARTIPQVAVAQGGNKGDRKAFAFLHNHIKDDNGETMTYVLRIDCPDEPGLVYKITGVLYEQGCNIVTNHEFVDANSRHFFMRTAFTGDPLLQELTYRMQTVLPPTANVRLTPTGKRSVVILVTKEPHCLGDLLLRHAFEDFPAKILAVISNYAILAPLVHQFGLPFHHLSHLEQDRKAHEQSILDCLIEYQPEYLVLAKYMRILSPAFVAHYPNRILNIHHSFLPAFMGASPYRQAFERGVKLIGATGHIVTDELDTGPIIAQRVLSVDHSYSATDMAQAGRDVEKIVLAKALKLLLEERTFLHQQRTIIFE
jgi:formyltetrahydrofolate deformylase